MKTIETLIRSVVVLAMVCAAFGAAAATRSAASEEKAVLAQLKKLYPATTFSKVSKTPVKGLYEVVMGNNIAYVDGRGRHFLFGHLFDMQTQSDLTALHDSGSPSTPAVGVESPDEGSSKTISIAELPLNDALKRVNGTGERTLIVFSDPLCPYCKRLEAELPLLQNTTIYTFVIPILGPNSRKAAEALWAESSPERAADLAALDRNLQLAGRYGINGTPTLVRADGQSTAGAMTAGELAAWMAAGAPQKTAQLSQ